VGRKNGQGSVEQANNGDQSIGQSSALDASRCVRLQKRSERTWHRSRSLLELCGRGCWSSERARRVVLRFGWSRFFFTRARRMRTL